MSEKTDALAGSVSQKASLLATFRSFTEHAGWKLFTEMIEAQKNARKGEVLLRPLESSAGIFYQEFMKGEISGLSLVQVAVFAQMEVLAAEIKVDEAKLEMENEREAAIFDAGSRSRVDDERFYTE